MGHHRMRGTAMAWNLLRGLLLLLLGLLVRWQVADALTPREV